MLPLQVRCRHRWEQQYICNTSLYSVEFAVARSDLDVCYYFNPQQGLHQIHSAKKKINRVSVSVSAACYTLITLISYLI